MTRNPHGAKSAPRGAVLAICALIALAGAAHAAEPRQLMLLNWSDYLDPELVAAFEAEFEVEVSEIFFETDESRDSMLVQADGKGYDLMVVDGTTLAQYASLGWLEPVDARAVPNLRHVDPRWRGAHRLADQYGVPYFWGTLGIGYRSDLVPGEIVSWMQLLRPEPSLHGRIAMIRDNRDLLSTALLALGFSPNAVDPAELAAARDLLLEQKPFVRSYGYISLSPESALVTGEIVAAMMYSGDALLLQEHDENITYVVPREGTVLWVDYLAVSAFSERKDLAMAFVNFLNEPENAAQLAEFVYYATPNRTAEAMLPEDFLSDPTIYPGTKTLDASEFYRELPPRVLRTYINITATVAPKIE